MDRKVYIDAMLTQPLEEWKRIVGHTWSGSYLIKNSGAHYRKALRVLNKVVLKKGSDWTGINLWGSPIVALAPPPVNLKKRICARLSITIGAGDAMISYPNINEIKNVLYEIRTNPKAA
jgi:hypothetical protein